jgi:hypothetical protein
LYRRQVGTERELFCCTVLALVLSLCCEMELLACCNVLELVVLCCMVQKMCCILLDLVL